MPCFRGLAVSIHTPDGPISEYSIQRFSRGNRITTYIPVPPPTTDPVTGTAKQSTFAISITLLVPGLSVPYSTPKPTPEDPYPRPKVVGGLPGSLNERGTYGGVTGPYIPSTTSPNETVAAYIYFDGRAKEEVATLLRKGEETWVNSRWVSIPDSEGGGLAEREFLFREVGLERWLNGLDLVGKDQDVKERIEKRRQRLERKRRKKLDELEQTGSDQEKKGPIERNGVLRYGGKDAPVETVTLEDGLFDSDSDSEDEPPMPEAAGQIKVALFRVLASGEIKRGEYSPQFDAHDDDEGEGNSTGEGNGGTDADIEHTTSFAQPKALDPKSISTQTVTGMDDPSRPYAMFTFFYRGEKQLKKMGVMATQENGQSETTHKRRNPSTDFTKLGPLNKFGTVGFSGYREKTKKSSKRKEDDDEMSDDDDEDAEEKKAPRTVDKDDDAEVKPEDEKDLSPEELARQREVAEGIRQIKLKRQHEDDGTSASGVQSGTPQSVSPTKNSPSLDTVQPSHITSGNISAMGSVSATSGDTTAESVIGSPFKKARSSGGGAEEAKTSLGQIGDVLGRIQEAENQRQTTAAAAATTTSTTAATAATAPDAMKHDDDEEL